MDMKKYIHASLFAAFASLSLILLSTACKPTIDHMANQTTPYTDIVSGVEALAGDSLTSVEKTRLKALINHRARVAYRLYDEWPEFLVIKEERRVSGTELIQGPRLQSVRAELSDAEVDTWLRLFKEEPYATKTPPEYSFFVEGGDVYPVGYSDIFTETGELDISSMSDSGGTGNMSIVLAVDHNMTAGDTLNVDGVTITTGTHDGNGAWTVVGTPTDVVVVAQRDSYSSGSPSTYDVTGAKLQFPSVWTDYKKRLSVTYGNESGETATVPRRWTDYLIRASYADFLRADGQSEKASAEEAMAQEVIEREIWSLDSRNNIRRTTTQIVTHGSKRNR